MIVKWSILFVVCTNVAYALEICRVKRDFERLNFIQQAVCKIETGRNIEAQVNTPPDVPKKQREPLVVLTPDEFKEKVLGSNNEEIGKGVAPQGGGVNNAQQPSSDEEENSLDKTNPSQEIADSTGASQTNKVQAGNISPSDAEKKSSQNRTGKVSNGAHQASTPITEDPESLNNAANEENSHKPKRIKTPGEDLSESESREQARLERAAEEALLAEHMEEQVMDAALKLALDAEEKRNEDEAGERFNYASLDAGAIIMNHNKAMKHSSALLISDRDKYALSPCEEETLWVTIGLSEEIEPDIIELSHFERYSSTPRVFQVLGANSKNGRPVSEWDVLGEFEAKPELGVQQFKLTEKAWVRYIKLRFISHWGSEFYCTLTEIRVYGSTDKFEAIHQDFDRMTDEVERLKETIDKALVNEEDPEKEAVAPSPEILSSNQVVEPGASSQAIEGSDHVNSPKEAPAPPSPTTSSSYESSPLSSEIPSPGEGAEAAIAESLSVTSNSSKVPANTASGEPSKSATMIDQTEPDEEKIDDDDEDSEDKPSDEPLLVAKSSPDGLMITNIEIVLDNEQCQDWTTRSHPSFAGFLCLKQKSAAQLANVNLPSIVSKIKVASTCIAPYVSAGTLTGTEAKELCILFEPFEEQASKVFHTLSIEATAQSSQTCIPFGDLQLCCMDIAEKLIVPKDKPDTLVKRQAKNSLESIFKSLTDKVMALEIEQSLLKKYLEEANSKYKVAIVDLQIDQEATEQAHADLKASLGELKASTESAIDEHHEEMINHKRHFQRLKKELESLNLRYLALQDSLADILMLGAASFIVIAIGVLLGLICCLCKDRSQPVVYRTLP